MKAIAQIRQTNFRRTIWFNKAASYAGVYFWRLCFFYSEPLLKIFDVVCHFMKAPEEVIFKSWNQEATLIPKESGTWLVFL